MVYTPQSVLEGERFPATQKLKYQTAAVYCIARVSFGGLWVPRGLRLTTATCGTQAAGLRSGVRCPPAQPRRPPVPHGDSVEPRRHIFRLLASLFLPSRALRGPPSARTARPTVNARLKGRQRGTSPPPFSACGGAAHTGASSCTRQHNARTQRSLLPARRAASWAEPGASFRAVAVQASWPHGRLKLASVQNSVRNPDPRNRRCPLPPPERCLPACLPACRRSPATARSTRPSSFHRGSRGGGGRRMVAPSWRGVPPWRGVACGGALRAAFGNFAHAARARHDAQSMLRALLLPAALAAALAALAGGSGAASAAAAPLAAPPAACAACAAWLEEARVLLEAEVRPARASLCPASRRGRVIRPRFRAGAPHAPRHRAGRAPRRPAKLSRRRDVKKEGKTRQSSVP